MRTLGKIVLSAKDDITRDEAYYSMLAFAKLWQMAELAMDEMSALYPELLYGYHDALVNFLNEHL